MQGQSLIPKGANLEAEQRMEAIHRRESQDGARALLAHDDSLGAPSEMVLPFGPAAAVSDAGTKPLNVNVALQEESAKAIRDLNGLDAAGPENYRKRIGSETASAAATQAEHLLADAEYARRLYEEQLGSLQDRLFAESVARSQEMTQDTDRDDDLLRRKAGLAQEDVTACPVCMENFSSSMLVVLGECKHQVCTSCAYTYLDMASKERAAFPIPCPTCREKLDPQRCLAALAGTGAPFNALETFIIQKIHLNQVRYCPNERCAQVFDWFDNPTLEGFATRYQVTCSACTAVFCVECKVPWHAGKSCEESRAERAGDESLQTLAQANRWKSCPGCGELVEKRSGCNFISCRCGCGFCYICGGAYRSSSSVSRKVLGTRNDHGMPSCTCRLF
jgi:IBR domain, a half RING-finger domain/Ring finger domain